MSIAISEDHQALADTAHDFLGKHGALASARALLEAKDEALPEFWSGLASLGWLGLHVPEEHGGSGFGLPELVVVVEELGRAIAPGPFVPTVAASAIIAACGSDELKAELLPGLADGSLIGAVALDTSLDVNGGKAFGSAGTVVSGALADVIVGIAGNDAFVVRSGPQVEVTTPPNIDPTRRAARVSLKDAPVTVLAGCAGMATDLARTIFSAEAVGVARECTNLAADYARVREQFGRPIAMFQAVKHHCANMLVATELATSSVWDAARAAAGADDSFRFAAAVAATHALPAADLCANLNTQVHGGIGMTWEHDCHLFVRRAMALQAVINTEAAATAVTDLTRAGVSRTGKFELPAEAEPIRDTVKAFVAEYEAMDASARAGHLLDTGYAMPHWPKPFGRDAGPIEQLVIEQEFKAAGVQRPSLGITGWVILTLIQHATDDQVARWVRPALSGEVVWCQLFSEPDAGSDAAGVKTKATRVDGGWLVNGQKVWTTGAQHSSFGLATVRTDPDAPKHNGITTMVIDMKSAGVEIRPLRLSIGAAEFNEIFFTDVFVPDDDVVGPVDGGWTVARATLGNESVSIGGGQGGGMNIAPKPLVDLYDAHPERLSGGAVRIGRYISIEQAQKLLNLRSIERAVSGAGPGAEGAVTKLVLSENGHEAAAMTKDLAGPDAAFMDGDGAAAGMLNLMHRVMSIAGGTSEIKRNQIGERLLGLPRDPLVK